MSAAKMTISEPSSLARGFLETIIGDAEARLEVTDVEFLDDEHALVSTQFLIDGEPMDLFGDGDGPSLWVLQDGRWRGADDCEFYGTLDSDDAGALEQIGDGRADEDDQSEPEDQSLDSADASAVDEIGDGRAGEDDQSEREDQSAVELSAHLLVELAGLTLVPEDIDTGRFSDTILFDLVFTNLGSNEIRAFTGTAVFGDVFGREIKRLRLTSSKEILPGGTYRDGDQAFELNQFSDEDQQLKNADIEDLSFEFIPQAILFTDGTLLGSVPDAIGPRELEVEEGLEQISVALRDVSLVPENISQGRFSDVLGFEFEYSNAADKEIRAFTGTAIFADLFGREIKRLGLTYDDPIAAGRSVIDADKGIELNQFSDEDQRLKNTEFENLQFFFVPQAIIFADGTQIGEVE